MKFSNVDARPSPFTSSMPVKFGPSSSSLESRVKMENLRNKKRKPKINYVGYKRVKNKTHKAQTSRCRGLWNYLFQRVDTMMIHNLTTITIIQATSNTYIHISYMIRIIYIWWIIYQVTYCTNIDIYMYISYTIHKILNNTIDSSFISSTKYPLQVTSVSTPLPPQQFSSHPHVTPLPSRQFRRKRCLWYVLVHLNNCIRIRGSWIW